MLLEAMCSSVLVLSQRDSVINSIACGRGSPQDIRPGGRLYTFMRVRLALQILHLFAVRLKPCLFRASTHQWFLGIVAEAGKRFTERAPLIYSS